MDICFLGTSAATAMPLPFCGCPVCCSARSLGGRDIRGRASIAVNSDMIIDLGPDTALACCRYGVDAHGIKYLLQTHAHTDHFDPGHLITRHPDYAVQGVEKLTMAASPKTLQAMGEMLKREDGSAMLFNKDFQNKLRLSLTEILPDEELKLGGYSIRAVDSLHDEGQQALVYLITYRGKTLFYGTDLLELSPSAYELLENYKPDILVLDQTYGAGYNAGGHLDEEQIICIIEKLKKKSIINGKTLIYASHISHEGNSTHSNIQARAEKHGYNIAYDGLKISI